jgi:NAD(P)-dependent dehydrogenase (short-subunit alcohol dehydrogenase family)
MSAEQPLAGRVAIVTGAASGIGRAAAFALAEAGVVVAPFDRDEAGLAATVSAVEAAGGRARPWTVDLIDTASLGRVVGDVVTELGGVDILVNAAGTQSGGTSLFDTTIEMWDRVFTVNLSAMFVLIQAVGRRMIDAGRGGRIVNLSSSSAFKARARPDYSTSKAGVLQLTRVAAAELGPYDINVNAVVPGLTRTAMTAGIGDDEAFRRAATEGPLANLLHRASEPEDVAAVILFLCLPASRQITGQAIHTSAGSIV